LIADSFSKGRRGGVNLSLDGNKGKYFLYAITKLLLLCFFMFNVMF
jgi:hypothetical protein